MNATNTTGPIEDRADAIVARVVSEEAQRIMKEAWVRAQRAQIQAWVLTTWTPEDWDLVLGAGISDSPDTPIEVSACSGTETRGRSV